ncbi:MAG: hypothetical protein ACI304_09005 [Lepagella sp.]
MNLFNIRESGSSEIVRAIGLISNDIDLDKWRPVLPFGIRDVSAIIGRESVEALADYYENHDETDDDMSRGVELLQQAVALFTWLKMIPTLDAQHDGTGRQRRLGENEKGLTALQEYKDEENIRKLGYEAIDALIELMERKKWDFWVKSTIYSRRRGLLIQTKEEFDDFYYIGSHRLFITLLPIIREVQGSSVSPILGAHLSELLADTPESVVTLLKEPAARAVALLTMQKAIERLPIEVIPEGVVQIQQSQPVNSRLRAEKDARVAVAASLGADARKYLDNLQMIVSQLDAETPTEDPSIVGPIIHTKGMTF